MKYKILIRKYPNDLAFKAILTKRTRNLNIVKMVYLHHNNKNNKK